MAPKKVIVVDKVETIEEKAKRLADEAQAVFDRVRERVENQRHRRLQRLFESPEGSGTNPERK